MWALSSYIVARNRDASISDADRRTLGACLDRIIAHFAESANSGDGADTLREAPSSADDSHRYPAAGFIVPVLRLAGRVLKQPGNAAAMPKLHIRSLVVCAADLCAGTVADSATQAQRAALSDVFRELAQLDGATIVAAVVGGGAAPSGLSQERVDSAVGVIMRASAVATLEPRVVAARDRLFALPRFDETFHRVIANMLVASSQLPSSTVADGVATVVSCMCRDGTEQSTPVQWRCAGWFTSIDRLLQCSATRPHVFTALHVQESAGRIRADDTAAASRMLSRLVAAAEGLWCEDLSSQTNHQRSSFGRSHPSHKLAPHDRCVAAGCSVGVGVC